MINQPERDDKIYFAPLNELDVNKLELPDSIVTPDGEWHDQPWSRETDSTDLEKWRQILKELYNKHTTGILVPLDVTQTAVLPHKS